MTMLVQPPPPPTLPPPPAPAPPARRPTRAIVLVAAVLGALVAVAIAVAAVVGGDRPTRPTVTDDDGTALTRTDHQLRLADEETPSLAAELVDVDGYHYGDISDAELRLQLDQVPDEVLAVNFHTVHEDGSGDEIAFLALSILDPTDAIHAAANDEAFARWATESDDTTPLTLSGQAVFLVEQPDRPDSRYGFVYRRHGTIGWVDGPELEPIETWLEAYLAVPPVLPGETDELVAHLVDVPGFSYTNTPDATAADMSPALEGADATMHYLFDQTHMFGGIVLVDPEQDLDRDGFIGAVLPDPGAGVERQWREIGGVEVARSIGLGGNPSTYVWWWTDEGIGGVVFSPRADLAEEFLTAFLGAQR